MTTPITNVPKIAAVIHRYLILFFKFHIPFLFNITLVRFLHKKIVLKLYINITPVRLKSQATYQLIKIKQIFKFFIQCNT